MDLSLLFLSRAGSVRVRFPTILLSCSAGEIRKQGLQRGFGPRERGKSSVLWGILKLCSYDRLNREGFPFWSAFNLITQVHCWFYNPFALCFVQDEIQRRPKILTLLESLSRYEAVAPTQEDDEEGAEAKTTRASQVEMKIKSPYYFEQSRVLWSLGRLCTFRSYANSSLKMA